ncbi:hypothetical protein FNF27_05382 [Cafeteria roenbergensis]|uniref:Roadblock/LAMTOR2 domain-containing protein n=1 Tax=Cafeteria roenbergensis TaxID=33653 RepID=A0A5A8E0R0_CAFRO|nr:hypothetical protein FNF31_06372 [Cafeteria roenbergensis]KAA0155207.1 hypothetical protein FNF29_01957 [Cafeteria roenbergensis]KAA0169660.1 hypothetical protein FNF28_01937 [Cafeteria roenbergensis]KAA0173158.1 hypothetical protein FNF27_05382 [Cafeteria roenbergensis]|mmetsp:Transcript_12615/g.48424  ORF Transcript_12615/g.48424 Transcript_12615/m.48424 type:complete len:107 (+) Transcript_12615:48-368(+)|eukprot:KAA0155207.1 hypothetical protein FNF29_01957 [Cafeteria roenbergensis]
MSAIEETLQRIERASNVTGFVILDNAGNVLRYRTDMGEENARLLATCFKPLLERSLSAVRDLDPTDTLNFLRVRMRELEVMAAPGPGFVIVVTQRWWPTDWPVGKV